MYRALYTYVAKTKNFDLSFEASDQFTDLEKPEGGWLLVQNGFGEIGYVPASYVEKEDNSTLAEILSSVDRAIQNIHYQAAASGTYTHHQRENLHKLGLHREHVLREHGPQGNVEHHLLEHRHTPSDSGSESSHHSEHSSPEKHWHLSDVGQLMKRHSKRPAPPPPAAPPDQSSQPNTPWPHHSVSPHTSPEAHKSPHSSSGSMKHSSPHSSSGSMKHSSPHSPHRYVKRKDQSPHSSQGSISDSHSSQESLKHKGFSPHSSKGSLKHSSSHESAKAGPSYQPESKEVHDNGWVHVDDNDGKPVSTTEGQIKPESNIAPRGTSIESAESSDHSTGASNLLSVTENKMLKSESVISLSSRLSISNSPIKQLESPSIINVNSIPLPSNLATELVGEVRRHTNLSYDKSCLAVEVVLTHIANKMPQTAGLMEKILCTFQEASTASEDDLSHDHVRIRELLEKITECKEDSQQRSWALHEDQHIISGYLEELLSILENAKPSTCRHAIASDGYECIHNLVQYYQMEVRLPLRLSLLKVFGALCNLESSIISHLLYSILPLELVSEIRNQNQEAQRLSYVAGVLIMIFCTGEPVPANLHETMNENFLDEVLEMIENPASLDHDDLCTDPLVNLLLAYNLHFPYQEENDIMSLLAKKGTVKVFTEKLLEIFNRGEDPVKMFDHQTYPVQSQVKFMIDMYSQPSTASLLYVNDAKVLIDILIRFLTDLQPGDKLRSSILILLKLLVKNSDYFEYQHKLAELRECIMMIRKEEEEATAQDRKEVEIILEEFNKHMKSKGEVSA
ncbi:NCK-interacting protein with SH3 domain-like [Saccostrea echinata]|uniref:NCK-interacting protein with SH3 domain-like n=1 Tax=Saccostrea echinata TaxID=191078 RepID=UPI002A80F606|nr:NCK-interacting protein with SH3 domain-like [Saccostrea echinata]